MVLTAYFALSPVIGLSCHRRLADTSARLDAGVEASGPHDFAVRERHHSSLLPPRPSHPAPYVRDDRETPLCVGRDGEDEEVIWLRSEPKYFCEGGWTGEWRHSRKNDVPQTSLPFKRCVPSRRLGCHVRPDNTPAPARSTTTIQDGIFHTVSSRKPASASAKSRGLKTALVQTGL
jgi:hypothetical protein